MMFFLLLSILLFYVCLKMITKGVEWSSYRSYLFIFGAFPVLVAATLCLIYSILNLFLPPLGS
jgi:hypothetical protein